MTGGEVAQIITAIAALVAACGSAVGVVISLRNSRKIKEVHDATNGMKTELVAAVALASESKGRDEERRHPTT